LLLGLERRPASNRWPAWQPTPGVSSLVSQRIRALSSSDHDSKRRKSWQDARGARAVAGAPTKEVPWPEGWRLTGREHGLSGVRRRTSATALPPPTSDPAV